MIEAICIIDKATGMIIGIIIGAITTGLGILLGKSIRSEDE